MFESQRQGLSLHGFLPLYRYCTHAKRKHSQNGKITLEGVEWHCTPVSDLSNSRDANSLPTSFQFTSSQI